MGPHSGLNGSILAKKMVTILAHTTRRAGKLSASAAPSRRALHQRVPLPYPVENGVGKFLSKDALNTVAVTWQQGVLDRLNQLVKGETFESASVLQVLRQTAKDPTMALTFNYASEALNNSFFLSTLKPSPSNDSKPSPSSAFSQKLSNSPLGSYAGLISHFSAHVAGLHPSSGAYVWLASDERGDLGVFGTYAGGTLLVQGGRGMGASGVTDTVLGEMTEVEQKEEEPSSSSSSSPPPPPSSSDSAGPSPSRSGSTSGWFNSPAAPRKGSDNMLSSFVGSSSIDHHRPTDLMASRVADAGPRWVHPLVCLSVHPHCYLSDRGVWGREAYVSDWWGAVDWQKVEKTYSELIARHSGR